MAKKKITSTQKLFGNYKELDRIIEEDYCDFSLSDGEEEDLYNLRQSGELSPSEYHKEINIRALWSGISQYEWEVSTLEMKCLQSNISLFEFHANRQRIKLLNQLIDYIPLLIEQIKNNPAEYNVTEKFVALDKLGFFESLNFSKISVQKNQARLLGLILGSEPTMIEKLLKQRRSHKTEEQKKSIRKVTDYIDSISESN
jgi:hypothetical protein